MECDRLEQEEMFEKYLTGRLGIEEQTAFEEHYFSCPRCRETLQAYRAMQEQLWEGGSEIPSAAPVAKRPTWSWAWAAGMATAAVIIGFTLWLRSPVPTLQPTGPATGTGRPEVATQPTEPQVSEDAGTTQPHSTPSPHLTLGELARVEPPPYAPRVLRGSVDEATDRFQEAMTHYANKDYAAAIPGLQKALELNPEAPNIVFFHAICLLLTDQTDAAILGLKNTIALGNTPYLEGAHFYLAKAFLLKGDLQGAQDELRKGVALHGEFEGRERELLRQIEILGTSAD